MKTFIKEITWLDGLDCGFANGYVIIPKGHKAHGLDYDDIKVSVHGGLTFARPINELLEVKNEGVNWDELTNEDKDGWLVGFDTCHVGDNKNNCNKEYVLGEVSSLKSQLENYN